MIDIKKNIVGKFHRFPHKPDFILSYALALAIDKEAIGQEENQKIADALIAENWELKRWFWSFLDNAVVLHTSLIEVREVLLEDFDVNLIVKTLKGSGVTIVITDPMV